MGTQISGSRSSILSAAIAAILASGAGALHAADDPLETITVTATRRAESIQDVPFNIAAVGGAQIEERGITNLVDISRTVPGLFVIDQGPRAANAIVVRGLNVNSIGGTEGLGNSGGGTVATYVDEIPLYVDLKLEDLERVEVLLGPQGTLYGAGTLGGAIRYIPRKPQFDGKSFELRANSYGLSHSHGLGTNGGFTLNLPLSDTLAFRASVDYQDDPGFIDSNFLVRVPGVSDPEPDLSNPADVTANLRRKRDVDFQKTLSGRAALRWQANDAIDATLTYYYQDEDVGGRTLNQKDAFNTDRYVSAERYLEPNSRKNQLAALEVTADLGFAELTSSTGVSRYEEGGQRDQTDLLITLQYSYEAFPTFSAFTREDQTDRTYNQEFRLLSKTDGPINWLAGLFYNRLKSDGSSKEFTPQYSQFLLDQGAPGVLRPDALEFFSVGNTEVVERAVYGEIGYRISDKWQVTAGGRYYKYNLHTQQAVDLPLEFTTIAPDGRGPNDTVLTFTPGGQKDHGTLFKFNTSYKFTSDVMGYVTVSEGFRIGNSNDVAPCDPNLGTNQNTCGQPDELQYRSDKTTNYEIGVHSQWFDEHLTLNGAVYFIDWRDPQLASATAVGALPIIKNGGGADTRGVEVSFDARLSERLQVNGSYGYVKAKLTETADRLVRGIDAPGFDVDFVRAQNGDRLPGTPEQQGNISATYTMPFNNRWDLGLTYGITAIGNVFTRIGNRAGGEALPGFALHSFAAALKADNVRFTLYAKNLFDRFAVTGVRGSSQFVQSVSDGNGDPVRVRAFSNDVVRPREVGLRVSYDFKL